MRTTVIAVCVLGFVSQIGLNLWAGSYELVRRIENPKGGIDGAGDEFGISVAFVGENVLVGAYREDTGAENAGAAYLFDSHGKLLTTFHNPDPTEDGFFGWQVASAGENILVAASGNQGLGRGIGTVYLFNPVGSQLARFDNPYAGQDAFFGRSIATLGDSILISDLFHDEVAPLSGAVHVFDMSGTLLDTILNPESSTTNVFGRMFAVDRNGFLVSSGGNGDNSPNGGSVYEINLDGQIISTIPNPGEPDNLFGVGLARLENRSVLVGAFGDADALGGRIYRFTESGEPLQSIDNPSPGVNSWFGAEIASLPDNRFVVGAPFDSFGAPIAGAAYLYNGDGSLLQFIPHPLLETQAHFATDIAVSSDMIVFGANSPAGFGSGGGAVYLYARVPEPATMILVITSTLFFGLAAWRRA